MAKQSGKLDLSTLAYYGRNFIKYGAIGLVFFMVARFTFTAAWQLYRSLNPPGPPPPTMGFGQLPEIVFPQQTNDERPVEFVLETVGQRFPSFPSQLPVYEVPAFAPDLLALDRAKQHAAQLGFLFEPEKISTQIYRWRQRSPFPASLEINIVNNTYQMQSDWASSVELLDKKFIPDERQAASELRTILRNLDLASPDVATTAPKITYLRALAGETKQVSSINEADFVQADIYRITPSGLLAITHQANHGVIRAVFSGSRQVGERLLSFTSNYFPVNWSRPETYPTQTAQQAWNQLLAGEGYVVNPVVGDKAVVRYVYLAYFEPLEPGTFFQPVYVFEGDNGFQAIVSAIDY